MILRPEATLSFVRDEGNSCEMRHNGTLSAISLYMDQILYKKSIRRQASALGEIPFPLIYLFTVSPVFSDKIRRRNKASQCPKDFFSLINYLNMLTMISFVTHVKGVSWTPAIKSPVSIIGFSLPAPMEASEL